MTSVIAEVYDGSAVRRRPFPASRHRRTTWTRRPPPATGSTPRARRSWTSRIASTRRRSSGSSRRRARRRSRMRSSSPASGSSAASATSTALVARTGSGPLRVAICAEYDALPAVGHACGHNIIAAAAVGAGWASGRWRTRWASRSSSIGTPAEEGSGGKVLLLDRGGFAGVHAAMMVHPTYYETGPHADDRRRPRDGHLPWPAGARRRRPRTWASTPRTRSSSRRSRSACSASSCRRP